MEKIYCSVCGTDNTFIFLKETRYHVYCNKCGTEVSFTEDELHFAKMSPDEKNKYMKDALDKLFYSMQDLQD